MLLAEIGCASASTRTSATVPSPSLTGYRLVGEWEAGPSRGDLRPYVRRRPLVQVFGQQEVVVFDDGAAFIAARSDANEDGFHKRILTGDELTALREDLARFCPALLEGLVECPHAERTSIACHLDSGERAGFDHCAGADEAGRQVLSLASRVIARVEPRPRPRATNGSDWYSRLDIERTLSPISYKRYVPASAFQADVQQGVAAEAAARRR